VLLAEDDAGVRKTVATSLERLGYRVLQAVDGLEAMEFLERQGGEVELLLTDIIMPGGLSGLELARRWRLKHPSVAVILTTGYSSEVHGLEEALQEGMAFLQKPYEIEQLGEAVRSSLRGRGVRSRAGHG
jgi:CheY-like chemotaxis protein